MQIAGGVEPEASLHESRRLQRDVVGRHQLVGLDEKPESLIGELIDGVALVQERVDGRGV